MLIKKPSKILTLLLIQQQNRILLAMKKKGFGKDKYNGFGGKVQRNGQTILEAALRETKQEGCIIPLDTRYVGYIKMDYDCQHQTFKVHIFKATKYQGEPTETQQMKPQWFNTTQIPYNKMWIDDQYWLPLLLQDKHFKGYLSFEGHQKLLIVDIKQSSSQQLLELAKTESEIKLQ